MSEADKPSSPRARVPRKLVGTRRLLIATIGAATVNYAGCDHDITMTSVANLIAPPFMPQQDGGPKGGGAGYVPSQDWNPPAQPSDDAGVAETKDEAAKEPGSSL
jgi:hypothetical protein